MTGKKQAGPYIKKEERPTAVLVDNRWGDIPGSITIRFGWITTKNIRLLPNTSGQPYPKRQRASIEPGVARNSSSLQCADLDVVKDRHKVRCDLGHFLFGDRLREILLVGLEDELKGAAVPGRPPYRNSSTALAKAASMTKNAKERQAHSSEQQQSFRSVNRLVQFMDRRVPSDPHRAPLT